MLSAPPNIRFLDLSATVDESRDELDAAYRRVMASGRWVLGTELARFEQEFAEYCGVSHCIGVGNGLDALCLALMAAGIGPGDEVIVPAHTFVATWLAVTRTGAVPVPVEPDPVYLVSAADAIDACMTPRTRAVVGVHLYGLLHQAEVVADLCAKRGVHFIEDAAQAHGADSGGRRAGSFGSAGCFSFYPSKNLGALGDGGAVVTDDPDVALRVRKLRNYGGVERYKHDIEGWNSRLDELQAAFLGVQLRRLDDWNARRKQVAAHYHARLSSIDQLALPKFEQPENHVWHLFVVRTQLRDALQQFLAAHGCETLVHYPAPVYRLAPFVAHAPREASVSDRLASTVLSLPMGPHLTTQQVDRVCDCVIDFFGSSR